MRRFICATGMKFTIACGLWLLFTNCDVLAAKNTVQTIQSWPERSGETLPSDAVLRVTEIGGVSADPSGRLVAFTTSSADPTCNCYHVRLNILDLQSNMVEVISTLGQPFLIPQPDGSINGWPCVAEPLWSRDGHFLAYMVNRNGHGMLYIYDAAARKSRNLDLSGDEAYGFTWDGGSDAIIYQTGGADPQALENWRKGKTNGYLFGPNFAADPEGMPLIARVPEARVYKSADAAFAPGRAWSDSRVIGVQGRERREATTGERKFVEGTDFSYAQQPHQDATVVSSPGGNFTISLGEPDPDVRGRSITIRRDGQEEVIRKTSAQVCPGTRKTRDVASAYWDDTGSQFIVICSSGTGGWLGGRQGEIVSLNPLTGEAQPILRIEATNPEGEFGKQCDVAAHELICVREQPSEPPALYAVDLRHPGSSVTLYDPNEVLRRGHFPRVDRIVWNNTQGLPNRADLVYPVNYSPGVRYPLVITQYTDGGFLRGNTGDENPDFTYAESGFFVLHFAQTAPAPEAPGLSFVERNRRVWRDSKWRKSIQDSLDIITTYLVDRGFVDASKVAYTGLSGGSNQIDYALANGRRIAVVITSTCCLDPRWWVINPLNPQLYQMIDVEDPTVDRNLTKWSAISPAMHVNDIHTAILANVSEHERFGFQPLWTLMQNAHKPMEVYVYEGEYHVKFQPAHLAAIHRRNIDWLRFWLQGYEDPDPAKSDQYGRWRQLREDWRRQDRKALH